MSEASEVRRALRAYALEHAATVLVRSEADRGYAIREAQRGELAGKSFEALQNVLAFVEEEIAEHRKWTGNAELSVVYALEEVLDKIEEALR